MNQIKNSRNTYVTLAELAQLMHYDHCNLQSRILKFVTDRHLKYSKATFDGRPTYKITIYAWNKFIDERSFTNMYIDKAKNASLIVSSKYIYG